MSDGLRRAALLVVVACVVVSGLAAPAVATAGGGGGAAAVAGGGTPTMAAQQESNLTVSQDGTNLIVRLDERVLETDKNLSVAVEDVNKMACEADSTCDPGGVKFNISNISIDSYQSVQIALFEGGKKVEEKTTDARYLALGQPARFDRNGQLAVPVGQSLGVSGQVDLTVENGGLTLHATVDGDRLVVQRNAQFKELLRNSGTQLNEVTLTPDGGYQTESATVNLLQRGRETTRASVDDGGITVFNPLLVAGEEYGVEATVGGGESSYVRSAEAVRKNRNTSVRVEPAAFESLRIAGIDRVEVFNGTKLGGDDVADRAPNEGTITGNNTSIRIPSLSGFGGVEAVWIRTAGGVRSFDLTETDVGVRFNSADETINLSGGGYELNPKATYDVVVGTADGNVPATVGTGDGPATLAQSSGDPSGEGGGWPGWLPSTLMGWGIVAVILVAGVVVVVFGLEEFAGDSSATGAAASGTRRGGVAGGGARTGDVTVRITDGDGAPVPGPVTVVAERTGGAEPRQGRGRSTQLGGRRSGRPGRSSPGAGGTDRTREQIRDGQGTVRDLAAGTWTVQPDVEDGPGPRRVAVPSDDSVEFVLGPRRVSVRVRDEATGDPVENARVEYKTASDTEGSARTDSSGEVRFEVPRGEEWGARVTHEDYESTKTTAETGDRLDLDLTPERGRLDVTGTVGGSPSGGVVAKLEPADEFTTRHGSVQTNRADDDGTVRFDGLVHGEYELTAAVVNDTEPFGPQTERVTLDGDRSRQTVAVPYEFRLSREQTDRLEAVREDVHDFVGSSRQDTAIPYYYGTVLEEVASTVEAVPERGDILAGTGVDPDRLVEALLTALEEATRVTKQTISSKRNVDLFAACANMTDVRVEWDGTVSLPDVLDDVETEGLAHRRRLADTFESIDDRIDAERSSLAETAPARIQFDNVQSYVQSLGNEDHVDAVARTHVALALLDAVGELFDHPELTDRMNQTVF